MYDVSNREKLYRQMYSDQKARNEALQKDNNYLRRKLSAARLSADLKLLLAALLFVVAVAIGVVQY
jgi:hypothetical protein